MTPEAGGLRASESAGAGLGSRDRCPGPAVAGACCRPGRRTAGSYGSSLRPRAAPPAARGPGRRRSGPGPGPWQLVTQAAFTAAARLTRRRRARWPVPGGVGGGRSAAGSRGAVSAGMASAGNRRHGDRRPRLAHRRQAARARVTRTRSRCTVPGSGPARRRAQPPAAAGVELSQPRPLSSELAPGRRGCEPQSRSHRDSATRAATMPARDPRPPCVMPGQGWGRRRRRRSDRDGVTP